MKQLIIVLVLAIFLSVACGKVKPTEPVKLKVEQNTVVIEFPDPNWALQGYWTPPDDTAWHWLIDYEVRNISREYIHNVLCWFQIDTAEVFVVYHDSGDFPPKKEKSGRLVIGQYESAIAAGDPPDIKDFGAWWTEYGDN